MQFLIDVNEETPTSLRLAASVLLIMAGAEAMTEDEIHAAARNPRVPVNPKPLHPTPPPVSKPQPECPPVPLPPGNVPPPPVVHPPVHPDAVPKEEPAADVPAGTEDLDPAQVFGRAGANVVPLVPVATATTPAATAPSVSSTDAGTSAAPSTESLSAAFASSNERDSAGLPWDARIHSETKKKNADGTWRFRRNLDAAVKESVMLELRMAYMAQPVYSEQVTPQPVVTTGAAPTLANPVPVPPAPAPVPVAPVATAAVPVPPPPTAGSVPAAPTVIPQPGASAVPMPPTANAGVPDASQSPMVPVTSFKDLMRKVNVALAGGNLTQTQLAEACKAAGVEGVTALAAQPMLVPTVDQYLNRWLTAAAA